MNILCNPLRFVKFQYGCNICENFKIIQLLRYFTCRCLNACSIQPANIFKIESKLYTLQQNIDYRFCKQTSFSEEKCLMCNKANMYKMFLYKLFHFMFHTWNLVHLLSMELLPCKLFNMLTTFKTFYRMFEMARECTLIKGTWFVA